MCVYTYRESRYILDIMFSQLYTNTTASVINVEQLVDTIFNSNNSSPYLYCTSVVSAGVDTTSRDYIDKCMHTWSKCTMSNTNCKQGAYNRPMNNDSNTNNNIINNDATHTNVSTQLNKYGYSMEDCTHIHELLYQLYMKYDIDVTSEM